MKTPFALGVLAVASSLVSAQTPAVAEKPTAAAAIQWYATWDSGLAAAKATGRPILLVSAAPHCHEAPGIW